MSYPQPSVNHGARTADDGGYVMNSAETDFENARLLPRTTYAALTSLSPIPPSSSASPPSVSGAGCRGNLPQ